MKLKQIFMGTLTALLVVFGAGRSWAADPVAKIGDETFETLEAAFASEKAKTADVEIELLSNVNLTSELDIVDFHGTLNLGGFELTNDDSWKAANYDYLIDLYASDVDETSSLVVTNGTLTLKDGHMMYVCAGATLTIAADATIAEVGTSNCKNPLRIYGKIGGHTGESSVIDGVINVYGKVTRTEAEGNTAGLDYGFIDQCLGNSTVNVYEGAVLSHEGGRGFKMSGGVPMLNIVGGTMTTGTNDMFHATVDTSINIAGGTFTMGSLFSADGASKSITVNGLGEGCTAQFSTTASKVKSLGDFCADGYIPMLDGDWYVIRLLSGSEAHPWTLGEGATAYTNGTELVIGGEGAVTSNLADVAGLDLNGIAAIGISSNGVTGVKANAFAGLSSVALTLPDGWQGELPDEGGNWYGATEVNLTAVPFAVRNVAFAQRWPWNGLVDIDFDLTGPAGKTNVLVTVKDGETELASFTVDVTIPENGVFATNLVWDATAALAENFNSGNVTVEVANSELPPMGQLWKDGPIFAECNVGATKPEEYGWYFWWGDTVGYTNNGSAWVSVADSTKTAYFYANSSPANTSNSKTVAQLVEMGFIDDASKPILNAAHDAATVHLDAPWRMPTDAEFRALCDNCDITWTTQGDVNGRLVTGRGVYSSRSIFLPAAGYGYESSLCDSGSQGLYWTSKQYDEAYAWCLFFNSGTCALDFMGPFRGYSVRPVCDAPSATPAAPVISAKSSAGMLDLRTMVALPAGETTISNVAWSATAWGVLAGADVTLGWTNAAAQTSGTLANSLMADGVTDVTLPKVNGEYRLMHSAGEVLSFPAFTVSGYPLGCESNPMPIGTNGDETAVMAVTNGANVYVRSGRTVVDAAKFKALCAGAVADGWFVSEDGSATNRIEMVLGPDGAYYETLSAALAADPLPATFTLFEVKGYWVSYDKGEDDQGEPQPTGEMETEMFVSTISTNLAANAFVRDDFVFDHWRGWTNGVEVSHLDQAAGVDFTTPGETLSLTAEWVRVAVWVAVSNVEHTTYTVMTNGVPVETSRVGGENEMLWRVATNANVTVTFRADSGYALDGKGQPAEIVLDNVTYGENDVVVAYPSVLSIKDVVTTKDDGAGNLVITGSAPTADGVLIIPTRIDEKNVVAIDARAFAWNTWLKELVIEEGVTKIGGAAFDVCTALEKVELPASLTDVGMVAFMRCFSLQTVAFKGNAPTIAQPATEYGIFWGAPGLDIVLEPDATGWDAQKVQTALCQYWQKLENTADGFRLTFSEDAVKPKVAALTSAVPKAVLLSVANAKPGLFYTVERSETPSGDWQPVARVQATIDGAISIPAPAEEDKGFYRVVVDDKQ